MSRYFQHPESYQRRQKGDKIWFGVAVIMVGVLLMLKKLGIFWFSWHAFWPVILIAVGLLIGIKKRFRNHAWWILILIGGAHLVPEFEVMNGVTSDNLVFPLALIIGGAVIALRSRKKNNYCGDTPMQVITNTESTLNIDVTFGGRKEIITSKDFRGGHISATFGGCEVNMIQADSSSSQPMVLDLKVSFGGVELIVPSHWELQNEIEPTFGSVEDHRAMRSGAAANEEKKLLILRGNCSFGSIEIKSY